MAWGRLKDLLFNAINIYIPKKQHQSQNRSQWFTSEIQHHLNKIHTLCKKARQNPLEHNKCNLKVAEDIIQQLIVSARHSYESTLTDQFSQSNSNKIYKFISSLTSSRFIPPNMSLDSNTFNELMDSLSISTQFLPRVPLLNHQLWIVQLTYHLSPQSAPFPRKFIIVFHCWMPTKPQELMA